jgi:hypothetical protein
VQLEHTENDAAAATTCTRDTKPFSVVLPEICSCTSSLADSTPGAITNLTITFTTNVDFPNGVTDGDILASDNITVTGLRKAGPDNFDLYFPNTGFAGPWAPGQGASGDTATGGVFGHLEFQEWEPLMDPGASNMQKQDNTLFVRVRPEASAQVSASPAALNAVSPAQVSFSVKVRNPVPAIDGSTFTSEAFGLSFPSMPTGSKSTTCGTVTVEKPKFTTLKIGQDTPYPCSKNAISVTLEMNFMPLNKDKVTDQTDPGVLILLEGLPLTFFPDALFDEGTRKLNISEATDRDVYGTQEVLFNPVGEAKGYGLLVAEKTSDGGAASTEKAQLWFRVKQPASNPAA